MATRPTRKAVRLYGTHKQEPKNGGYQRVRSAEVYHSARWTKASRIFREEHPLCAECQRRDMIQASEVVDHIVPYPICTDFFDETNWQPLCKKCNALKGARDRKKIQEYKAKVVKK